MKKGDLKKFWKKFWFIIWKDDSPKGWLFSIIFLFIFIKFIFFPVLSLATGTSLPLAIVESCSMYHKGNLLSDYGRWWEKHESKYSEFIINNLDFEDFIFKDGFNKGDILFVIRANPEKLEIGDTIIFEADKKNPVIHRIIKIENEDDKFIFSTMGDNVGHIQEFEKEIEQEQLVGKAVFKIAPYIGWGKLIFFEYQRERNERGLCKEN